MSNTAKISLGGQEFDIPELPIGVMKKLWPLAARMGRRAMSAKNEDLPFDLSEENLEDTMQLVYMAIAYGKPGFTREEFDNLVIDLPDLIAASITVTVQAGGKKLGEHLPAAVMKAAGIPAAESSPISTQSLPTSASPQDGPGTTSSGQ